MEIKCPKCGAADPMYSTKRAVYLCEECEHEWSAESLRSERPLPLRVFLSYGHDRNEELVLRIKSDLEERGHDVWLDKSEIKFTDDWRRAITEGIVESQRILSFLSRHSTRDPGVCLDEIAIAIGVKGGNIQTILVESELEVCPPASVSHVQWLDMHDWKERRNADEKSWEEWYGRKLEEIVRVVESEESRRFAGEMEDLKRHLQPVPSDSRINELIAGGFVGREWMKADLEKWRASEDRSSRIYWITGEPGAGKSAFAAYLSHYGRDRVVGAQFVQWDKPDHRNPERVVRNIAFQLAARLPDYRKLLLDLPEKDRLDGKNASELFDYLLAAPLSLTIGGGRERYLVVIDALDEAGEGGRNAVAEMLAGNVNRLPAWLCFVVTSRPESAVLRSFQRYDPFEISSHEDENRRDMREYLKKALADELAGRDEDERKRILEGILQRSEDVFLYVACVCEEVKEGRLSLDRPDEFPRGLGGVYSHYFERQFPDVGKYKETIRPMLQIVLASRESFPLELLRRRYGMTRGALSDLLAELSSLFHVKERAGEKCLSVYHKTLADWLTTDERSLDYWISLEDGNEELAEWGMELYRKAGANDLPEYFLRYLPAHLIESRREKDAAEFLADLDVFEKIHEKSGAEYALGEYWRRLRDGFPPAECYHASLRRRWPEESPEVERTHEEELERIEVHNTLSLFFGDVLADYKNAKAFSREVFSLCEKTLGADHLHTVVALNNLAGLFRSGGRVHLRQAPVRTSLVDLREDPRALPPPHCDIAEQFGRTPESGGRVRLGAKSVQASIIDSGEDARGGPPRHCDIAEQSGGTFGSGGRLRLRQAPVRTSIVDLRDDPRALPPPHCDIAEQSGGTKRKRGFLRRRKADARTCVVDPRGDSRTLSPGYGEFAEQSGGTLQSGGRLRLRPQTLQARIVDPRGDSRTLSPGYGAFAEQYGGALRSGGRLHLRPQTLQARIIDLRGKSRI